MRHIGLCKHIKCLFVTARILNSYVFHGRVARKKAFSPKRLWSVNKPWKFWNNFLWTDETKMEVWSSCTALCLFAKNQTQHITTKTSYELSSMVVGGGVMFWPFTTESICWKSAPSVLQLFTYNLFFLPVHCVTLMMICKCIHIWSRWDAGYSSQTVAGGETGRAEDWRSAAAQTSNIPLLTSYCLTRHVIPRILKELPWCSCLGERVLPL